MVVPKSLAKARSLRIEAALLTADVVNHLGVAGLVLVAAHVVSTALAAT